MQTARSAHKASWIAPLLVGLVLYVVAADATHLHNATGFAEDCVQCLQQGSADDLTPASAVLAVVYAPYCFTTFQRAGRAVSSCYAPNARAPPASQIAWFE